MSTEEVTLGLKRENIVHKAQTVCSLPAVQETRVQFLGPEDPLEKEMATHSSILAWRRKWQPTPVFLPGESHGQRSLAGYSPQGRKSRTQLSN